MEEKTKINKNAAKKEKKSLGGIKEKSNGTGRKSGGRKGGRKRGDAQDDTCITLEFILKLYLNNN